jgi:hypothetical protein
MTASSSAESLSSGVGPREPARDGDGLRNYLFGSGGCTGNRRSKAVASHDVEKSFQVRGATR